MVKILFLSNADFVVQWLSGFAGATHIFVTSAIKNKYRANMYLGCRKINCQDVREKGSVRWEDSTEETVTNFVSGVAFAEDRNWMPVTFD